jgi:hypothetical protein
MVTTQVADLPTAAAAVGALPQVQGCTWLNDCCLMCLHGGMCTEPLWQTAHLGLEPSRASVVPPVLYGTTCTSSNAGLAARKGFLPLLHQMH